MADGVAFPRRVDGDSGRDPGPTADHAAVRRDGVFVVRGFSARTRPATRWTLRLFRPDVEIGVVRIRPVPRRHAALRHESSRLIHPVLREAVGAMTTRELARAVMEARGMNTADHAMAETMRVRLASTLRKLKARGKMVAEKREGKNRRRALP